MSQAALLAEQQRLADLLEAIQRCAYFLNAPSRKIDWPLLADTLQLEKKNVALFEALAAIN
ncbi:MULTISPECIES: hypothetical protein [unclassified Methylomonas]|uniref:hypothetical protein n=1 Tax=unclassified Methylomonas TaxID=2608980 RepID=UPI001C31CD91|nr:MULTISPECIES: hypothetical protein [unclassified Methylomonas]WGS87791.1 hypothetical protein QC632_08525 [Methylomonas sp. UP202]